jgi:peroxiredoxin
MCHLQDLYDKYQNKNLVILGFNASDDKKIALEMMRENGVTFPNILDASEAAEKISFTAYRASGVPLNYIIDPEGKIVDAWYGYEEGHPRAKAALQKLFLAQRFRDVLLKEPKTEGR